ncbi:MAG TPA: hypothetical protein VMG31_08230 [Verrucomicrobiae bacterium]|nr:hypothetical protein [Verrucomicrobiae bacterium]
MKQMYKAVRFFLACGVVFASGYFLAKPRNDADRLFAPLLCALAVYSLWRGRYPAGPSPTSLKMYDECNRLLTATVAHNTVVSKRCGIGLILSLVSLLDFIPSVAQSDHNHATRQQTSFGVEEPFEHVVVLPSGALKALETSSLSADMLRDCAENEGMKVSEIPTSWFEGSWIALSGSRSSGLVVRAEYGCFFGAHIAQFWLLSKAGQNYRVVFTGRADAFRVLPTRTNGYCDVQLIFAMQAGAEIRYVTFKYTDGEYKESNSKIERPYDK